MKPLTFGQSTPRYIGGAFTVAEVARRLARYAYAEMRLMEAQAGWIPFIAYPELKIELAYSYYDDACHVNAMYERLPDVGDHRQQFIPANDAFVCFCNELTNTEDLIEQLVGVFWVLRPHLAEAYRAHLAADDSTTNNPTVRLIASALADHERYIAWGERVIRELAADPADWARAIAWRDHLGALLDQAGGVLGDRPRRSAALEMPRDDGPGKRLRKDLPHRDSRFRIATYERHEGRAATDVWDHESLLKYWFMMVEGELEATESCSRTLYDFPDAPWPLRFQVARQAWDEARHAELSMQRFLELGGTFDMLPVRDTFPLYLGPVRNDDMARRLAHLNQVIEGWVTDDFAMMVDICRGLGDERSARLFEYLIADEWAHIKIGADWIPWLTAQDSDYRQAVIEYRTAVEREHYRGLAAAAAEVSIRRANGEIASSSAQRTQPT